MVDWSGIESKWRQKWIEGKDFETNPSDKEKKFITVAYPYPNSPQHIGHGRTYTLADVHARYYRMKGYNVLFPMGFHYTGTPILGMAKRVEAGDTEIIDGLKNIYHVSEEDIKTFVEPIKIADYFHEEIKAGMIEMGYSIDWRREFTTIDPVYQKFIEWQISTLREKNLIIQGSHPVGWCPKDQNPVSQHDTLGDVEPDFTEYILIKFKFGEYIIPTATLRPETLFGVTNLWVNPKTIYKKISVDGEKWIVSSECARKLEFLDKKITYDGEIPGSELIGEKVYSPHLEGSTGRNLLMLPASFVESQTGTGIVMSVPAHAPFDYQALADFKKSQPPDAKVQLIKPISIIQTEEYGEFPAKEAVEKLGISDQNDPKLEEATQEIYGKEFYGGKLKSNTGPFVGKMVSRVKDEIKKWLIDLKYADILLELTNSPVRCRCGAECVVKILNNQWFLNYGDADWKEQATKCLHSMSILPQEIQGEFDYVIGWLRERACARQHGLGTKLPWDKEWIVESLSDSVIYMAYYTLAKFVNAGTLQADNLSKAFFEYVFLGNGSADGSGVEAKLAEEIRKEFSYFYPVDSRHSGRDLVPNHLTFFVLNHVAIFPENNWPKQIVVNGSVLMDGKKMSKSMGNIIPLRKAIQDYGADPIRLAIIVSAELLQDADFNLESIRGIQNKLGSLLEECSKLKPGKTDLQAEDKWILSKLQSLIEKVSNSVEKMRLREGLHDVLFSFEVDLNWYLKRAQAKGRSDYSGLLHEINSKRVAMLSPFAPHIAEEMWEKLGNSDLVSKSSWPAVSADVFDANAIQSEDLLKSIMDDIVNIIKITKITPKKIAVYTADAFKGKAYHAILAKVMSGDTNMGAIMKELIANPETSDIKKNPDFVQKTIKDILSEPVEIRETRLEIGEFDEKLLISSELRSLAKADFGVDVQVFSEKDSDIYDPKGKARHARPYKPAILIE
jgi:leucyl-tRNA synthetase